MPVELNYESNPSEDIYKVMDESGITLANFQRPGKRQVDLINEARVTFAQKMKIYITNRDQKMIRIGQGEMEI